MKLKIKNFIPYLYQVAKPSDNRSHGDAKMCRIRIHPDYTQDEGLFMHELEHVKQWWILTLLSIISLFIFSVFISPAVFVVALMLSPFYYGLLYEIPFFRMHIEAICFRVQNEYYDIDKSEQFAEILATKYDLKITKEKALKLIRGK